MKSDRYSVLLCLIFVCFFLFNASPCQSKEVQPKKINIISNKNGVGLSQDIEIIQNELEKMGHQVTFIEDKDLRGIQKADINVLVQPLNLNCLPYAEKNYLIPNPEWSWYNQEQLSRFDLILCKTKEAVRIFEPINPNTVYMGFTCKDRFDSSIQKDYKRCLHLAGKSTQKGTNQVVRVWLQNPQWPDLTVVKFKEFPFPPASNICYRYGYLPFQELLEYQNGCGIHLCPSETEGFGYYIMEALSCGSVVVTTDAPPMNEFVSDQRCLIGYERTAPQHLATNYYIDSVKFDRVLTDLFSLSESELQKIGETNREFYLENDRLFKQRIVEIFSDEVEGHSGG
jgi:hypothetical protein